MSKKKKIKKLKKRIKELEEQLDRIPFHYRLDISGLGDYIKEEDFPILDEKDKQ